MKKAFLFIFILLLYLGCKDKIGVLASLKISDVKLNNTSNQYLVFVKCSTDDAKFNGNPFDTLHTYYRWIEMSSITISNGYTQDFINTSKICAGN